MISFPYTSQMTYDANGMPIYDRASNSEEQRKWNNLLYTDGVDYRKSTAFQVVANSGMTVNVLGDGAWCKVAGAFGYENERARTVYFLQSDTQDRIDRVVLRNDFSINKRAIDICVLKGIASNVPQAPTLTKNGTIHEIALADIFIEKNTTSIPQNRITDLRLNSYLCGTLGQAFKDVDFSQYFLQIQALIDEYKNSSTQSLSDLQESIIAIVSGNGSMLKVAYDTNNTGIVDDSEKLGGELPSFYAAKSDGNMSTVEKWTGRLYIDSTKIYSKTIGVYGNSFVALAHGIVGLKLLTGVTAAVSIIGGDEQFPIPNSFDAVGYTSIKEGLVVSSTTLYVSLPTTGSDYSTYIELFYTKIGG